MQPVQDLSVDDRISRTQYQYSLEDANADELERLGAEAGRQTAERCRSFAMLPAISRIRDCRHPSSSIAILRRDSASRRR